MMKLYWSSRSPFVRKVMIVVHELGLEDRVATVRTLVHPARPNAAMMAVHPIAKIPVLILDDGTAVYDSRVICEFLDAEFGGRTLVPGSGLERWRVLTRHAMVDALLETCLVWLLERARPAEQRQDALIDASRVRIAAGLDALERDGAGTPESPFTLADVAAASALAYLDFRFGELDWRAGRPALAGWYDRVLSRPSIVNTGFVETY
ncbi:glutathione S-transferase [Azospirillum sp. RWY-5-1]|uniref:Glutathione S-transferase n=1 Tax=Azospirillum oleiclasticum TaxID=2735135 RepID=A0ABX2TM13_9PROT|nr:glutathione S-transferase N-terminal domain-containing protein [Azospirillum oleiclasticum]NYZ14529.1 glutathione S-transferase [Azospirillum oleiclasticum]NYZ24307.1 glutathione S-transferase [Azospirillum oleiclasticum]